MKSPKEIGNWYNSFSNKQLKTGINLRHYRIMDFLIESGLQKNSNVLEILYETAHAEYGSALEMFAACKKSNTASLAFG